jgi:hypothetical protein
MVQLQVHSVQQLEQYSRNVVQQQISLVAYLKQAEHFVQ